MRDGTDGVGADGESAVGQGVDQVAQDLGAGDVGTGREGEGAGAAEGGGGIGFSAPDGLHLNVMDATKEGCGFAVIEGHEGFGDGVLGPTLRVALDGLFEEAIEGAEEIGEEVWETQLGGHFGGFGDDQVDTVRKGLLEGDGGLGGGGVAEEIEAFDLSFDLAVRHKSSVVGAARCGVSARSAVQASLKIGGRIFTTETQRGRAASCRRSAFSHQLLDESGQHPFDFDGIRSELFVKSCWKELKILGEQQMMLQPAGGTAGDGAETSELCTTNSSFLRRPRRFRAPAMSPQSQVKRQRPRADSDG